MKAQGQILGTTQRIAEEQFLQRPILDRELIAVCKATDIRLQHMLDAYKKLEERMYRLDQGEHP